MARISLPCALILLVLGTVHVQCQSDSSEPCDAKVSQLKAEAKKCQEALKATATDREVLELKVSSLGELPCVACRIASPRLAMMVES